MIINKKFHRSLNFARKLSVRVFLLFRRIETNAKSLNMNVCTQFDARARVHIAIQSHHF